MPYMLPTIFSSSASSSPKQPKPQGGTFVRYEERAGESANGQVLYGMDRELAAKRAAGYDAGLEAEARAWVERVARVKLSRNSSLQAELRSGVVLGKLVNAIKPGVCPKPSDKQAAFHQMNNISNYLVACEALGVCKHDLFQTVALYENKDMMAVLANLQALGSAAQCVRGYRGALFGAKRADANVRNFSAATMTKGAAETTILGKGSHGCATAAGIIDMRREIVKTAHACSSVPTKMGTASRGQASQVGMTDTRRNIVKVW